MHGNSDEIATMYLIAKANRQKQITSASRAVNYVQYYGILPSPPPNIAIARWRAMVNSIINRGLPT